MRAFYSDDLLDWNHIISKRFTRVEPFQLVRIRGKGRVSFETKHRIVVETPSQRSLELCLAVKAVPGNQSPCTTNRMYCVDSAKRQRSWHKGGKQHATLVPRKFIQHFEPPLLVCPSLRKMAPGLLTAQSESSVSHSWTRRFSSRRHYLVEHERIIGRDVLLYAPSSCMVLQALLVVT